MGGKGVLWPPFLAVLVWLLTVPVPVALAQERGPGHTTDSTYRRPLRSEPTTLDPARIVDIYGRSVTQQIFDGLVQFDHTLNITPALAQFWRASRDGLTWTFTLRRGVKFHHGRELTAEDVVYSIARLLDPRTKSAAADLFGSIKGAAEFREGRATQVMGLVAVDRYTVQVSLNESLAPFVLGLAVGHAKIVPKDLVEQQGEAFGSRPVGTGPFKFSRWDRGQEILLSANPDYFQGAPALARVSYRIYSGKQFDAIYADFVRRALEDAPVPSSPEYHRIIKDPGHQYIKRPMFSLRFYGFNTRTKPLNDRRVRQALAHALDREAINDEFFFGRYLPAHGILPPGTLGFNPRLSGTPYAPQRARELLAQAGYPGGTGLPPIEIVSSVNEDRILREHEYIRKRLETVGVRLSFRYVTDWPAFSRGLAEGRFPAFLYAWFADVPDPDNFLFKLFHSRSSRNLFAYANPMVDDMLTRARGQQDAQHRVELYRQAEQLILDDAPMIPVWHYTYERLFQPYVRSVEVSGLGDPYIPLRKIWLDRRE
jgi:peptide/nickel transport system substrate-binding protein/oligopeptide transport system substrate-binding protein